MTLLDGLRSRRLIVGGEEAMTLSREGVAWCARIGIDLGALRVLRRPLLRPCLDWSERRSHLAGALGAALLDRLLTLRLARRELDSRALRFSPRGEAFLARLELARSVNESLPTPAAPVDGVRHGAAQWAERTCRCR